MNNCVKFWFLLNSKIYEKWIFCLTISLTRIVTLPKATLHYISQFLQLHIFVLFTEVRYIAVKKHTHNTLKMISEKNYEFIMNFIKENITFVLLKARFLTLTTNKISGSYLSDLRHCASTKVCFIWFRNIYRKWTGKCVQYAMLFS